MNLEAAKLDIKDGSQSLPYTPWLDPYTPNYAAPVPVSTLLPPANGLNTRIKRPASISDTVVAMKRLAIQETPNVKKLADWLKADTLEQSAYNVWHFLKTNIEYKLDETGKEQLRTPARAWLDRFKGIDCDCYSIFASALLRAMGYNPRFRLVAFRNRKNYSHVYVMVENFPLDAVMNLFNVQPKGITKFEDFEIDGSTNGLSGCNCKKTLSGMEPTLMMGLGAVARPNNLTLALMERQNQLLELNGLGSIDDETAAREFRKVHFGVLMNGLEEQTGYVDALPYMYDVEGGNAVFKPNVNPDAVAMIGAVKAVNRAAQRWAKIDANDPATLSFADYTRQQVEAINGLGDLAATTEFMGQVLGELEGRVPKKRKKRFAKFKKGLKKFARGAFLRFNPLTVIARNAFLALVILNFPKQLGAKLAVGYFTPEDAQRYGLNYAELEPARKATKKAENLFYKLGGKRENFKKAVMKGWKRSKTKKALDKAAKNLKGLGYARELVYWGRDLYPSGQPLSGTSSELVYSNLDSYPSGQIMGLNGSTELVYRDKNNYPSGQIMGLDGSDEMDEMEAFAALMGELIYTDYAPQMEKERQAGNLGAVPVAVLIAKAGAVLTPVAVILKKAAPAFKAVSKVVGKVKEKKAARAAAANEAKAMDLQQQQVDQQQQIIENQNALLQQQPQPQPEQQAEYTQQPEQAEYTQETQAPTEEGQPAEVGNLFKKIGKGIKKVFKGNPAKKAARKTERQQQGTRLARFIKKTTGVDLRRKDRRNDPVIQTDGGIAPQFRATAAQYMQPDSFIAKTSFAPAPAPDFSTQPAASSTQTKMKFPLKTVFIIGGGLVVIGGVVYLFTRKKTQ